MGELVTLNAVDGLATITLNNPGKRNALSAVVLDELRAAIRAARAADPNVVVLASRGPVFCAGFDLGALAGLPAARLRAVMTASVAAVTELQALPCPVIAKVQGLAAAAGAQLVASCDFAVAAESASFSLPGIKRGLFCHTGMLALSRAIAPKRALELALTGDPINAATAVRWGLVTRCVPDDQLDATTAQLAAQLGAVNPGPDPSQACPWADSGH